MSPDSIQASAIIKSSRRTTLTIILLTALSASILPAIHGAESREPAWRTLPLITDGKVNSAWLHVG